MYFYSTFCPVTVAQRIHHKKNITSNSSSFFFLLLLLSSGTCLAANTFLTWLPTFFPTFDPRLYIHAIAFKDFRPLKPSVVFPFRCGVCVTFVLLTQDRDAFPERNIPPPAADCSGKRMLYRLSLCAGRDCLAHRYPLSLRSDGGKQQTDRPVDR